MVFADLHMHSSASDGTLDATRIADLAAQTEGLHAISITDHDSLAALEDARLSCAMHDVDFVPGVEITTRHAGRAVHMLGYFVDANSSALAGFLDENRRRRAERVCKMADLLHDQGYPVCAEDLLASEETPNRPLLARLLLQRGCVSSVDDAFRQLLGSSSPCYIDAVYPETIEAMRLIAEAGGCSFAAHPARYRIVDLIARFAREGMTGLEAYHTMQSPAQSAELVEIAHDLGLGVSGGSDWHGDDVHRAHLGGCGLSEDQFRSFQDVCGRTCR